MWIEHEDPAAVRIHRHRVRLGLSPEQYGIRIGCAGMTVRRVEAGYTPFRSTQAKFARDIRVPVDELFGLELDRGRVAGRKAVA